MASYSQEDSHAPQRRRPGALQLPPGQVDEIVSEIVDGIATGNMEKAEKSIHSRSVESKNSCKKAFYHLLIHECGKAEKPRAASWCARQMIQIGIRPNAVTVNSVINAFAKVGDVESAIHWWDEMPQLGVRPTGITYNTVLHACAKAGDGIKAEEWFHRMTSDGVLPCIVSYGTVINAFTKMGLVEKAEEWFRAMQTAGLKPDSVIFNSLISACAKDGLIAKAEYWYSEMHRQSVAPDGKTYNSLINTCARAGSLDRAESWFKEMERWNFKADSVTFGSMIHACARAGQPEEALIWVNKMMTRGNTPNTVCFNAVLHSYTRTGNYKGALEWFQRMRDANVAPNKQSYAGMIEAFARAGLASMMEAWIVEMVKNQIPVDDEIFDRMQRSRIRPTELDPNSGNPATVSSDNYARIIRASAHAGDLASAKAWQLKMVVAGYQPPDKLRQDLSKWCADAGSGGFEVISGSLQRARAAAARPFKGNAATVDMAVTQGPAPRRRQAQRAAEQSRLSSTGVAQGAGPQQQTVVSLADGSGLGTAVGGEAAKPSTCQSQEEDASMAEKQRAQLEDMWRRTNRLVAARRQRAKDPHNEPELDYTTSPVAAGAGNYSGGEHSNAAIASMASVALQLPRQQIPMANFTEAMITFEHVSL